MSTLDALIALTAFAFVSSITPGPNNLMLMASGANFGFRRTIPHLLGVGISFVAMIVLIGLGLAQIFERFPLAHTILKAISVVYLLYLAWKIANATAPEGPRDGRQGGAKPMTFLQAVAFQWVNPKAWTMALTAVTVFLPTDNPGLGLFLVAVVFGVINLPSVSCWTLMGVQLRRWLSEPAKLRAFNWTAALLLVASLYPIVFAQHA